MSVIWPSLHLQASEKCSRYRNLANTDDSAFKCSSSSAKGACYGWSRVTFSEADQLPTRISHCCLFRPDLEVSVVFQHIFFGIQGGEVSANNFRRSLSLGSLGSGIPGGAPAFELDAVPSGGHPLRGRVHHASHFRGSD